MSPKTSLIAHTHTRNHLIFHLLLNDLKNGECVLTCSDETTILKNKGDSALFDYSLLHGSENNSETERIHFIVDFDPS